MPKLHASTSPLLLAIFFLVHYKGVAFSNAFRTHDARPQGTAAIIEDKTSSMMTLNFAGETAITSDVAAVDNKKSLRDFFALPHVPSLILRGSKNNKIQELENIEPELFQQYEQACDRFNALPPLPTDRIFQVTASGLKFPGVQVMSTVTIGVKIIFTAPDLPGYELVVIRDETQVKSRFFNTAKGKDKKDNDQTTFSVNRISVARNDDDLISFKSNANLNLLVNIPKILLKAIPGASKEMFEKKGGESLQKTLENDILVSLEEFRREYLRWLDGSQQRVSANLSSGRNWSMILPWNWKRVKSAYVRWLSLGLCSS